jgi:hypothetical protein
VSEWEAILLVGMLIAGVRLGLRWSRWSRGYLRLRCRHGHFVSRDLGGCYCAACGRGRLW